MRTKEALAVKKSEGVILGRRKGSCVKLEYLQNHSQEIEEMLCKGWTVARICRHLKVSRDTFYKFRKQQNLEMQLS